MFSTYIIKNNTLDPQTLENSTNNEQLLQVEFSSIHINMTDRRGSRIAYFDIKEQEGVETTIPEDNALILIVSDNDIDDRIANTIIDNQAINDFPNLTSDYSKRVEFLGSVKKVNKTINSGVSTHSYECYSLDFEMNKILVGKIYEGFSAGDIISDLLAVGVENTNGRVLSSAVAFNPAESYNQIVARADFRDVSVMSALNTMADFTGSNFSFQYDWSNAWFNQLSGNSFARLLTQFIMVHGGYQVFSCALHFTQIKETIKDLPTFTPENYIKETLRIGTDSLSKYNNLELEGIASASDVSVEETAVRRTGGTLFDLQHEYSTSPTITVLLGGDKDNDARLTIANDDDSGQVIWDKSARSLEILPERLSGNRETPSGVLSIGGADVESINDGDDIFTRAHPFGGFDSSVCFALTQGGSINADLDEGQWFERIVIPMNARAGFNDVEQNIRVNVLQVPVDNNGFFDNNLGEIEVATTTTPSVPFYSVDNTATFQVNGNEYTRGISTATALADSNVGRSVNDIIIGDFVFNERIQANPRGFRTFVEIELIGDRTSSGEDLLIGYSRRDCIFYNRFRGYQNLEDLERLANLNISSDYFFIYFDNDSKSYLLSRQEQEACPLFDTYWSFTETDRGLSDSDVIQVNGFPIVRKVQRYNYIDEDTTNTGTSTFFKVSDLLITANDFLNYAKNFFRKAGRPNITGSFTMETLPKDPNNQNFNLDILRRNELAVGKLFKLDVIDDVLVVSGIDKVYKGTDNEQDIYHYKISFTRNQPERLEHIVIREQESINDIFDNSNRYQKVLQGTTDINKNELDN